MRRMQHYPYLQDLGQGTTCHLKSESVMDLTAGTYEWLKFRNDQQLTKMCTPFDKIWLWNNSDCDIRLKFDFIHAVFDMT